jgi:sulfite reductase (NADPH) flavoprotein alpha-component
MTNLPSEELKLTKPIYDRHNPYLATLVECRLLTKKGSSKEILHIVCDFCNSDITYEVGSSFAILPENLDLFVDEVVKTLGEPYRNFVIETKNFEPMKFGEFLKKEANLSRISSQFLQLIEKYNPTKELQDLLLDKERVANFCKSNNLSTFLHKFWHPTIPLQELTNLIFPMLPRYYSVASSMKKVGSQAHFMVASFYYPDAGKEKESITASFLKSLQPGDKFRLFLQPNPNFLPPEDTNRPMIMIGPGTGLASLRGFLQERESTFAKGKNWLFTGDRQKAFDFHYEDELTNYVDRGILKLSTAFSRDSDQKVYVQDLLMKEKKEIWSWIITEEASIYICGDAKAMAKDVQKTLHLIAELEGNMSPEEAKAFFKNLRLEKRLLLDIY